MNDFFLPSSASARTAGAAQAAMWSSHEWMALYPYFSPLEMQFQSEPLVATDEVLASKAAHVLSPFAKLYRGFFSTQKRKYEADVLVVGECWRDHEIEMMKRLLLGLMRRGLSVLYLVSFDSDEYKELNAFIHQHRFEKRLICLDPMNFEGMINKALFQVEVHLRQYRDWCRIQSLLPKNIYLPAGTYARIRGVARAQSAWALLEPRLRYGAAIVRNHFTAFSAAVALSGFSTKSLTVTFQHGVISTPDTLNPIVTKRMVCFGEQSRTVLAELEDRLVTASGRPSLCRDFVPAGSLFDNVTLLTPRPDNSCLLVIDQEVEWASRFFGIQHEFEALRSVVSDLLAHSNAVRKIIIRLHPSNQRVSSWINLLRKHPERIEISHPAISFDFDLSRCSVVMGLFSGALAMAAARGIPALFLWEPGWYYTPDLSPFVHDCFVSPADAIRRIEDLMADRDIFIRSREKAIEIAASYYKGLQLCSFDSQFIDRLLRPVP